MSVANSHDHKAVVSKGPTLRFVGESEFFTLTYLYS